MAGWSPMAGDGKTDINMAAPKETVTKMKSIFDSCSVDQLTGLKDMAEKGLRNLVAEHSEDDNLYQYILPNKALNDLETNLAKILRAKKGKEEAMKNNEKAFAIADMTQHILNFICPGQILILSTLDEVRHENKQLKQRLKNLENIKSQAVTKDDLKEMMGVLNGVKAEISEVRTVAYQLKANAIQDSEPNNAGPGPRNQKALRGKKTAPSQREFNNVFLGLGGKRVPGLPYQDQEPNSKRNPIENQPEQAGGGEVFVGEEGENQDVNHEKFTYVGYNASRKRNQTPKVQEKEKRSKKELIAAREIIIHGLATPVDKLNKVKEAILIGDTLDELRTKFLGPQGINIDIEKDIAFHERIVGHHDAKLGYQPVKIRFRNQTFCEKVKKAASAAGALNGRRKVRVGKYRLPKILDEKGNPINEDKKVLEMHNSRPDFFFSEGL